MKKKYTIRSAFRRWCELTGDYTKGEYSIDAPVWFIIEMKAMYHFTITKTCKKIQRFTTGLKYEFILSDEELLRIKPIQRNIFMKKRKMTNRHVDKAIRYKENANDSEIK